MTINPTEDERRTAASVNVLERFNIQAVQLTEKARKLDAAASDIDKNIARHEKKDAQDRAQLAEIERRGHELSTTIHNRSGQLVALREERDGLLRQRDEASAEAAQILGIVEREQDRLAAANAGMPVLPSGVEPFDVPQGSGVSAGQPVAGSPAMRALGAALTAPTPVVENGGPNA